MGAAGRETPAKGAREWASLIFSFAALVVSTAAFVLSREKHEIDTTPVISIETEEFDRSVHRYTGQQFVYLRLLSGPPITLSAVDVVGSIKALGDPQPPQIGSCASWASPNLKIAEATRIKSVSNNSISTARSDGLTLCTMVLPVTDQSGISPRLAPGSRVLIAKTVIHSDHFGGANGMDQLDNHSAGMATAIDRFRPVKLRVKYRPLVGPDGVVCGFFTITNC